MQEQSANTEEQTPRAVLLGRYNSSQAADDLFTTVEKFFGMSKILAMLLSHCVMLLKLVLYN